MRPQFLRSIVSIEPFTGSGAAGPTYGSATPARASVQPDFKLIIDANGREVQATVLLILLPGAVCPAESRVTAGGKVYRALVSSPIPDIARPTHQEVYLGSFA